MITSPQPTSGSRARKRVSAACTNCRIRRSRCVKASGNSDCDPCRQKGLQCVTLQDDKRKQSRHVSKSYIDSLEERLRLLESMLPQSSLPAIERPIQNLPNAGTVEANAASPIEDDALMYTFDSSEDDVFDQMNYSETGSIIPQSSLQSGPEMIDLPTPVSPSQDHPARRHSMPVASKSRLLRYSTSVASSIPTSSTKQLERAEQILQDIPIDMREYLLSMFWVNYNVVMRVVHKEAFLTGRSSRDSRFYSAFLELCIMAMGSRFSDMKRVGHSNGESQMAENTFCNVANLIADYTLGQSRSLPTVQGLLILSDLNIGYAKESVGSTYLGMACRLSCELCLSHERDESPSSELENYVKDMVFCACIFYDRNWSLFFEKPNFVNDESAALGIHHTADQHLHHRGNHRFLGFDTELELQIYETRIPYSAVVGDLVKFRNSNPQYTNHDDYLRMAKLDKRLNTWYTSLPDHLKWAPDNILRAPMSLLLLHQKFHGVLILLHLPFACLDQTANDTAEDSQHTTSPLTTLSRTVCLNNSARIAEIFKQYQQIFDTAQLVSTGIHPAGTAALTLVAGQAFQKTVKERIEASRHIQYLTDALEAMSRTYPLARKVLQLVQDAQSIGQQEDLPY